MKVLVDFDGVVADLYGAQITWMNKTFGTTFEKKNITTWHWDELFASHLNDAVWGSECFRNPAFTHELPPIWGALQALRELQEAGHDVFIVSHRDQDMFHWIAEWFDRRGFPFIPIILTDTTDAKLDVARQHGMRIAVEDNPFTARLLAESGQFDLVVIFDAPYNRDIESTRFLKRAVDWVEVLALIDGVDWTSSQKIALFGKQHAGKSTVSRVLQQGVAGKRQFTNFALAEDVKLVAVEMVRAFQNFMGMDVTFTLEELLAHKDEFRWILQGIGTNLARNYFGPDTIWIDRFLTKIHDYENAIKNQSTEDGFHHVPRIVCDDLRFPNEAEALREDGFILVRVDRPEEERLASLRKIHDEVSLEAILNHESEKYIDLIVPDFVLHNTSENYHIIGEIDNLLYPLDHRSEVKKAA